MAQLSGKAAAIENKRGGFIRRQFAFQLFKLCVRDAHCRGNVSPVEFGAFGPRIHKDGLVGFILLGDIFNGNRRIISVSFHPCGETVGKNFNIGITKFFRLPGGFMTQLSGGTPAVKDEQ